MDWEPTGERIGGSILQRIIIVSFSIRITADYPFPVQRKIPNIVMRPVIANSTIMVTAGDAMLFYSLMTTVFQ